MSFGRELREFVEGFTIGSEYLSDRAKDKYYRAYAARLRSDINNNRVPGPSDYEAIPDPFDHEGGGGKGNLTNITIGEGIVNLTKRGLRFAIMGDDEP